MQDQLHYWDNAHARQQLHEDSLVQTAFAEEVNAAMPVHGTVLELGCGEGNDSVYFARQGHKVEATDFSGVVIEKNRQNLTDKNLHFSVQDISQTFPYADRSFDVVYARLSLHYFPDKVTQKIFSEINRVLKPGGYVYFMCKSVEDKIYGHGTYIEEDMYELDGHVRHFFSEAYVKDLARKSNLQIKSIEKGAGKLYERQAAYIKVIAQKDKN